MGETKCKERWNVRRGAIKVSSMARGVISIRPWDSTRQFPFHGTESRAGLGGDSAHRNNR